MSSDAVIFRDLPATFPETNTKAVCRMVRHLSRCFDHDGCDDSVVAAAGISERELLVALVSSPPLLRRHRSRSCHGCAKGDGYGGPTGDPKR
jgi:hypothetical protein